MSVYAPVAQWIEQWFPKPCARVRFPPGAHSNTSAERPSSIMRMDVFFWGGGASFHADAWLGCVSKLNLTRIVFHHPFDYFFELFVLTITVDKRIDPGLFERIANR